MGNSGKRTVTFLLGAVLIVSSGVSARAAYYHDLIRNRQPCSDCHTLHYSEGGKTPTQTPGFMPMAVQSTGPYAQLLVRSTATGLCLFCHDGTEPRAPDVLADNIGSGNPPALGYYSTSGDEHSGAGYFGNSGGTTTAYGHDLGVAKPTPYSTKGEMTLTCASCHEPHGTEYYRNILKTPAGGTGIEVFGGTDSDYDAIADNPDVFRQNAPGDPPTNSASIQAYKESNLGYRKMSSKWCAECHDKLKDQLGASARVDLSPELSHHLADVKLSDFPSKNKPDHWVQGYTGGTPDDVGFDLKTGDTTEGVPRLRFQVSASTTFGGAQTVAADNEMICATCHLAHGGKYKKALVWLFRDTELQPPNDIDKNSGCSQCHEYGP